MARTATVTLRPGVTRATLPNNRAAVFGTNYVISWEDFEKISPDQLRKSIQVVSISDAPQARRGDVNLALNATTVPTGFHLGQEVRGYGPNDVFRLVKLADAVAATDGMALTWVSKLANTVTADRVGGTAATPLEFAGFALGAITAGRYAWIQVDGVADAPTNVGDVGDAVTLHPTVDGGVRPITDDEVATLTNGGASAGNLKITFQGQQTANIAFGASAAAVQSALEALNNIAPGDVVVTGTSLVGAGVTITFAGNLDDQSLTDMTIDSTGLTGGPAVLTVTTQGYGDVGTSIVGTSLGASGVSIRGSHRRVSKTWR